VDASFFSAKRPWSRYKDYLLKSYLEPYIPKVNKVGKPILIVDCFAGRGRFEDGSPGSPLIIAEAIRRWRDRNVPVSARCTEADPENFAVLHEALTEHRSYVQTAYGTFDETLPALEREAKQNTVFLYVDPYTVKGLRFERMKRVYDQIRASSSSVEVLMNFNVAIFMRWAMAAVKRWAELPDREVFESMADDPDERVEKEELSEIAGGDYWIKIAEDASLDFNQKLSQFLSEYTQRMRGSFRYVTWFTIKEKYHHTVPKYVLIFATRHDAGVRLMNDFMCQARRDFVREHVTSKVGQPTLFDLTPAEEVVEPEDLDAAIIKVISEAESPIARPDVQLSLFLHGYFARITQSEVKGAIRELLKSNRLRSSTGKVSINDKITLTVVQSRVTQKEFF
jgi:three-Cys-motif partner protein